MNHFFFSKKQKELISEYEPNRGKAVVLVNGNFVEFTEQKPTNKSNWGDAIYLGTHHESEVRFT